MKLKLFPIFPRDVPLKQTHLTPLLLSHLPLRQTRRDAAASPCRLLKQTRVDGRHNSHWQSPTRQTLHCICPSGKSWYYGHTEARINTREQTQQIHVSRHIAHTRVNTTNLLEQIQRTDERRHNEFTRAGTKNT